jgi:hypothetical protein
MSGCNYTVIRKRRHKSDERAELPQPLLRSKARMGRAYHVHVHEDNKYIFKFAAGQRYASFESETSVWMGHSTTLNKIPFSTFQKNKPPFSRIFARFLHKFSKCFVSFHVWDVSEVTLTFYTNCTCNYCSTRAPGTPGPSAHQDMHSCVACSQRPKCRTRAECSSGCTKLPCRLVATCSG